MTEVNVTVKSSPSGGGSRIVFGTILVVVGVLLLLAQFGWWDFGDILFHIWPFALILFGLWQWAARRFQPRFWPIFLIVVGLFWLAAQMRLLHGGGFGLMTGLLLIGFGVWLVFRKGRQQSGSVITDAASIDHWVMFGGVEENLTTQQFNGGNATAVFGGVDLDLRKASLAPGDVVMNLSAIFGGVEVKVPEDWDISVEGTGIFGAVEDKTGGVAADQLKSGSRLIIRATAIFGGVEISR